MSKSRRIEIDVSRQRLDVIEGSLEADGKTVFSTPVSTSWRGLGCESGSFKTPTGNFVVAEKIGAEVVPGTVFRSRVPTGETAEPGRPEDQITSRILWLDGVDAENANSKSRYIYIHGTNDEARLGAPASHGCVRVGNAAIIDLFDLVETGAAVSIA